MAATQIRPHDESPHHEPSHDEPRHADATVHLQLVDGMLAEGSGELRDRLAELMPGGTRTLSVDLSAVERLSSTCVATLLWVKRSCSARGVHVVLANTPDRTLEVLTRTGLTTVFEIESRAS